ncbi:hypothetical protein [Anoxybacteroides amylolyticum]|uniref:Uncharacterized protein n=1 Tax=Anoxybacteroides amylolyticum TaxID=294699 RepID=A0A160F710_9BACL|nr:hypothetical protein [Anoxybacillus amylolyticus]ANB61972.1 hypothetical protein GFC30_2485 [Anoxybacillus amylolyticus]
MRIRRCYGYELEKAQPNTSEDFFNRSEVTFVEDGEEKTLHVLYVRYFDELFPTFTPYAQSPIFTVNGRDVSFKDIVALVCLLKNPSFRHRKRVYVSDEQEFRRYFEHIDFAKLPEIFSALEATGEYELLSPLLFIVQPS